MSAVPQDIPRSTGLQRLRDRNRGDVTLASGVEVGLHIVPLSECFDAGVLPTPVTQKVLEARKAGKKLTKDELEKLGNEAGGLDQVRTWIARCIETLWGDPVEMTGDDTKEFSDEEFAELYAYCHRDKPLPGKE